MDYNHQHRGTNSKTHSRSGFQYADWLIQVLIVMIIILVKWTAILYAMKNTDHSAIILSTDVVKAICDHLYKDLPKEFRNISQDLGGDLETRLRVGLVAKGLMPKIDTSDRILPELGARTRARCVLISYSHLFDRVEYEVQRTLPRGGETRARKTCSIQEWESWKKWSSCSYALAVE